MWGGRRLRCKGGGGGVGGLLEGGRNECENLMNNEADMERGAATARRSDVTNKQTHCNYGRRKLLWRKRDAPATQIEGSERGLVRRPSRRCFRNEDAEILDYRRTCELMGWKHVRDCI